MTDSRFSPEIEALAKRLQCSENSILRLSGRSMPMKLNAAERDIIAAALRASLQTGGYETLSPEAFSELLTDLADLNVDERTEEALREADRRIRELSASPPPAQETALVAELAELGRLVADSNVSPVAIGMRIRNTWPLYERAFLQSDGGGNAAGVPAQMQGSNDCGLAHDDVKPEDTTQGDRPARPVTCPPSDTRSSAGNARPLDWLETFTDRGDGSKELSGWEADSGFGSWYSIEQYFGSDSYGWQVKHDFDVIADHDDPEQAKESAQADFEKRVRAALRSPNAAQPSAEIESLAGEMEGMIFPSGHAERQHIDDVLERAVKLLRSRPVDVAQAGKEPRDKYRQAFNANKVLRAVLEDAVETLEAMGLHLDNPLYGRLRDALEGSELPSTNRGSPEDRARAAGWISEFEYNGEDDGVRHPHSGNWSENWEGACAQIESSK